MLTFKKMLLAHSTKLQDPFSECGATTHVLRPGWSPEGSMLVSAHAMNGGGPTGTMANNTVLLFQTTQG